MVAGDVAGTMRVEVPNKFGGGEHVVSIIRTEDGYHKWTCPGSPKTEELLAETAGPFITHPDAFGYPYWWAARNEFNRLGFKILEEKAPPRSPESFPEGIVY